MLRRVGLAADSLNNPEVPVGLSATCRFLECSAEASGAEDFGRRLAQRRDLSNLGPIGLVAREEPTAMRALDTVCRYVCLISEALLFRVVPQGDMVEIRAYPTLPASTPARQAMGLTVGMLYRIVAELLGATWAPVQVGFEHRAPLDAKPYRRFFGIPATFNAEFDGMVCRAADLNRPLPHSKSYVTHFAAQHLHRALQHQHLSLSATAQQFIAAMLAGGRCTVEQFAAHLGIDRRTVHRHLAIEDTSFRQLLQSARMALARRLVADSDLPVTEISTLMGFAVPNAFSAWFTRSSGCSAIHLRNQAR